MRVAFIATLFGLLQATSAAAIVGKHHTSSVREIFHFTNKTWIENLAVRPNGHLLLDTLGSGQILSIDPWAKHPVPRSVASLPSATAITGIVEVAPDVFAVSGGLLNSKASTFYKGTVKIYLVSFPHWHSEHRHKAPRVHTVAKVPNTELLNGMTSLPRHPHVVLSADSLTGSIYRIDTRTGAVEVAIQDSKLAPGGSGPVPLGINGLKAVGDYVYFTNTDQQFAGRFKISPEGYRCGEIEEIAKLYNPTLGFDDFSISRNGTAFAAVQPSSVYELTPHGKQTIFLGGDKSTLLKTPTSTALSRDGRSLYVVTGTGQIIEARL